LNKGLGSFPKARLAVSFAAKAKNNPQDFAAVIPAVGPDDGSTFSKINLPLSCRRALHSAEGQLGYLPQTPDEAFYAVVTAGKTMIRQKILMNPLGREALLQLGLDDLPERFAVAFEAGNGTARRLRRAVGPGGRVSGRF